MRFSSPTQFMAQRKTTIDEAYAGDIIGLPEQIIQNATQERWLGSMLAVILKMNPVNFGSQCSIYTRPSWKDHAFFVAYPVYGTA